MEIHPDYSPLVYKVPYDTVEDIAAWIIVILAILTVTFAFSLIEVLAGRIADHPRAFARKLRNLITNTIDFFSKLLAFTRELGPRFTVINLVGAGFFYIASLVVYSFLEILVLPLNPDESIQAGGLKFFGVIACAFTIYLELQWVSFAHHMLRDSRLFAHVPHAVPLITLLASPFAVAVCNLLSTTIVESDKNYAYFMSLVLQKGIITWGCLLLLELHSFFT
ncbi:unnamed protein product [Zymoseptoria tritici ST99CH_1A5]|uniref:Uncharacterized protein n=1 Tax=Zymoseptoria tritici ST99CH_1A5 TaxID=1276529 RepID=A0A1Y6LUK2_ZYMTR|nr:unnamed protein product [Zymoseptoria tritici ST99CH_1A5]